MKSLFHQQIRQPHDGCRPDYHDDQTHFHEPPERKRTPVNIGSGDFRRSDTFQIKQGIAEGRCQEGVLQHDGHGNHKPDFIKAEMLGDGQKDRKSDHDDADPVDEHPQNEKNDHHDDKGAPFAESDAQN